MPPRDRIPKHGAVIGLLLGLVGGPAPWGAAAASDPPVTARDRAIAWVESRGWKEGPNPDGAIVSVGAAPIPPASGPPTTARALGFELACLDARNGLAGYLAAEVAAVARATTSVAPGKAADVLRRLAGEVPTDDSGVLVATFEDAAWVLGRCELSALVPVACFRTGTTDAPGMISVVLRRDAGSASVAAAFLAGAPVDSPPGTPGIDEWIASRGSEADAGLQGVRVLRGPGDKACLVSFAESDVIDEPLAERRAEERARLAADAGLRSFLGQFHDGQAVLTRSSTLVEVAGVRPEFQSVERYRERVRSRSEGLELPRGARSRRWQSPAMGVPRTIGVAVVFEPGRPSHAAMPSRQAGASASVEVANRIVRGQASGVGVFIPAGGSDRAMHPALRRSRALRAAVVNAKAELARTFSQSVATTVGTQSDERGESSRLTIDVSIQRALLCGMALVRCEFSGSGDQPECTAWIEGAVPLDPAALPASVHGLPSFPSESAAAEAVARWASSGLCDQSMVRVFVDPSGSRRLVDFGVGLGVGPTGATVALAKAQAALVSAAGEVVEGTDRMSQQAITVDPLSPAGSRSLLLEEVDIRRVRQAAGTLRLGGSASFTSSEGVIAVACWRAE